MPSVVIEMSGDEAKLWRSQQRIEAKNKDVEASFGKVKKSGKDAGDAVEKGFGGEAISKLGQYAGGIASMATVIGQVTQAWQEHMRVREEAMNSSRALEASQRNLVQLAQGRDVKEAAEDLRRMEAMAQQMAIGAGIPEEKANQVIFSARSQGFEQALPFITENAVVIDPEAQAILAGKVPGLFPGRNLSSQGAIAGALASSEASQLNVEQIAGSVPAAAKGASLLGATPGETLTTLAVLAKRHEGQGDVAANSIKGFAAALAADEQKRFAGLGLLGALDKLQAMSEAERQDIVGKSQELNIAYTLLNEEEATIRKNLRSVDAAIADPGEAMEVKRGAYMEVHGERLAAASAEQELAITRRSKYAENETRIQANADYTRSMLEQEGAFADSWAMWAANWSLWWDKNINPNASGGVMYKRAAGAADVFDWGIKARMMERLQERLDAAAERFEKAAARAAAATEQKSRGATVSWEPSRGPVAQRHLNAVQSE